MAAVGIPLEIECYSKFYFAFFVEDAEHNPIDLTDYTARMAIRETLGSETAIWELSDDNGYIVFEDREGGRVGVSLPSAVTQTFRDYKTGVWDLYLIDPDGERERYLEGTVRFDDSATREF